MYANFGRAKDFKALKDAGIDVTGKVVIMRYGPTSRGAKVGAFFHIVMEIASFTKSKVSYYLPLITFIRTYRFNFT